VITVDPFTNCARKGRPFVTLEAAQAHLDAWRAGARAGTRPPIIGNLRVFPCKIPGQPKHYHLGRLGGQRSIDDRRRRGPTRKAQKRRRRRVERS